MDAWLPRTVAAVVACRVSMAASGATVAWQLLLLGRPRCMAGPDTWLTEVHGLLRNRAALNARQGTGPLGHKDMLIMNKGGLRSRTELRYRQQNRYIISGKRIPRAKAPYVPLAKGQGGLLVPKS
eukprot:scaffold91701_cov21-Tisochrysis_lutea.AAC.1